MGRIKSSIKVTPNQTKPNQTQLGGGGHDIGHDIGGHEFGTISPREQGDLGITQCI